MRYENENFTVLPRQYANILSKICTGCFARARDINFNQEVGKPEQFGDNFLSNQKRQGRLSIMATLQFSTHLCRAKPENNILSKFR